MERRQLEERAATIWPISFAIGIVVLLVGLIVNPFVIASLGGAITLIAGFGWVRGADRTRRPATSPAQTNAEKAEAERFPRSRSRRRFLEPIFPQKPASPGFPTSRFRRCRNFPPSPSTIS